MEKIIPITAEMTRTEKMHARKHNREVAFAEMQKHDEAQTIPKLTEEEEKEVSKLIQKIIDEALSK